MLFNLVTRHEKSGFNPSSSVVYVGVLLALAGPGVWAALLRWKDQDRGSWSKAWRKMQEDGTAVFVIAFTVPLAVFFLVAFIYNIGAHWMLSF